MDAYQKLPVSVRAVADKNFDLLRQNPKHPSLNLKRIGNRWSALVGRNHRALAMEVEGGLLWVWIGAHAEYERLIS